MTTLNPVRKVPSGTFAMSQSGRVVPLRAWAADCPQCDTRIMAGASWFGPRSTRKLARDLLCAHLRQEHTGPGGDST